MTRVPGDRVRILGAADIADLLTLDEIIRTQREAFTSLASGTAFLGPRILSPGAHDETAFVYTARMSPHDGIVVKAGSVVPGNTRRGLPTVHAAVLALDADTGRPRAFINGETVTVSRTVAASMLAIDELVGAPQRIAIIGYGAQGRAHAVAAHQRYPNAAIVTWQSGIEGKHMEDWARSATSAADAVAGADLVITCTTSPSPVVEPEWLEPGATVVSIGSFAPNRREVGDEIVGRSNVVVDDVAIALAQAGPIRHAVVNGLLDPQHLTSLGDVLTSGFNRDPKKTWTFYNSVGIGIQDAALVRALLARAESQCLGTVVEW